MPNQNIKTRAIRKTQKVSGFGFGVIFITICIIGLLYYKPIINSFRQDPLLSFGWLLILVGYLGILFNTRGGNMKYLRLPYLLERSWSSPLKYAYFNLFILSRLFV